MHTPLTTTSSSTLELFLQVSSIGDQSAEGQSLHGARTHHP